MAAETSLEHGREVLFDRKILNILIRRAAYAKERRYKHWFGLSIPNLRHVLHLRDTKENTSKIREALHVLDREGLAYSFRGSRPRWFPSTRAVAAHGFAEGSQTKLEKWI